MDAKSFRNMYSIIAVTNKHTAKLHHVGSLYILTQNYCNTVYKLQRFTCCVWTPKTKLLFRNMLGLGN